MSNHRPDLRAERINYTQGILTEHEAGSNPHDLFDEWMRDAIHRRDTEGDLLEPNAMVLSTVNPDTGFPDSRTVLLKEHADGEFVFFGNYLSRKGLDISAIQKAALNFTWLPLQRQIRIQGTVGKISPADSDAYFAVRPRGSQVGAWASSQSEEIDSAEHLAENYERALRRFEGQDVKRPPHWGGWTLAPTRIEFWQGRASRLHDRVVFTKRHGEWVVSRVQP